MVFATSILVLSYPYQINNAAYSFVQVSSTHCIHQFTATLNNTRNTQVYAASKKSIANKRGEKRRAVLFRNKQFHNFTPSKDRSAGCNISEGLKMFRCVKRLSNV